MAQISFPARREGTREAISDDDDAVRKGDLHLVAIATRENNRGKREKKNASIFCFMVFQAALENILRPEEKEGRKFGGGAVLQFW